VLPPRGDTTWQRFSEGRQSAARGWRLGWRRQGPVCGPLATTIFAPTLGAAYSLTPKGYVFLRLAFWVSFRNLGVGSAANMGLFSRTPRRVVFRTFPVPLVTCAVLTNISTHTPLRVVAVGSPPNMKLTRSIVRMLLLRKSFGGDKAVCGGGDIRWAGRERSLRARNSMFHPKPSLRGTFDLTLKYARSTKTHCSHQYHGRRQECTQNC